jgi:CRP-like cAMP-binding protein
MNTLIESLCAVVPLTRDEQNSILSFFKGLAYKKSDYFLKQGMVCRKIGFVEAGAVYYKLNGPEGETICDFGFENQWCTHYKSLNSGEPSEMNIIALENSQIFEIDVNGFEQMIRQVPKVLEIRTKMAEKGYIEMSQRSIDLATRPAEERYSKLLETQPNIMQRVPLSMVASYLGVTQRHLSRLRSTIR